MIGKVRIVYRVTCFSFWLFFTLFHKLRVYGVGHTARGGGIIASNHASFYDPPLIAATCPEEIHFLARRSLFRSFFGRLIAYLNAHPISSEVSSLSVIKETCALLEAGKKVVIFPEGVRSENDNLGEVKSGVSLLAFRSKCHIIPAYIHGSFSVWSRYTKLPKPWGRMAVVYGSPIELEPFLHLEKCQRQQALTGVVTEKLNTLRQWYEQGCHGEPP